MKAIKKNNRRSANEVVHNSHYKIIEIKVHSLIYPIHPIHQCLIQQADII